MAQEHIKLIVAGSRDFTDYRLLRSRLDFYLLGKKDITTIISGCCRGADHMGEAYANHNAMPLIKMPAEWDKYGDAAGPIRNEEMAKIATHCVVFCSENSKGSKNMIELANRYKLNLRIVKI